MPYVKPASISGLNTDHDLHGNIAEFMEFGVLNKELVGDTDLTTTATTVNDSDIGICKEFDGDADAVAETIGIREGNTVLIVHKNTATFGNGDADCTFIDCSSSGHIIELNLYNSYRFETKFRSDYSTQANSHSGTAADQAAIDGVRTAIVTIEAATGVQYAINGTITATSNQSHNTWTEGIVESSVMSSVGTGLVTRVAAIVIFDKILTVEEVTYVGTDPWAMVIESNTDPVLDSASSDITIDVNNTSAIDFGSNFSDGNSDSLTFSISPDISALAGWAWDSATGIATPDGSQETSADTYTIEADDGGGGTLPTDVVDITVTEPSLNITGISSGPIYAGESISIDHDNASESGKTYTINGQEVLADSQNSSSSVITCPDPKVFGDQSLIYDVDLTIEITDVDKTDTVLFTIVPDVGDYYVNELALTGFNGAEFASGLSEDDNAYAVVVSGTTSVDLENGTASSEDGAVIRIWYQDESDNLWNDYIDRTIPASSVPNVAATGQPAISGSTTQGETLTASQGTIADDNGLGALSFQWLRDDVEINGATELTYLLVQSDVLKVIKVQVSYTDNDGHSEGPLTSEGSALIANINDLPAGTVSIDNSNPVVGNTIQASNNLSDIDGIGAISYQWKVDSVNIDGATGTTYTVSVDDLNSQLSVLASYVDSFGASEFVESGFTENVLPRSISESTSNPMPDSFSINTTYPLSQHIDNPDDVELSYTVDVGSLPSGVTLNSSNGDLTRATGVVYSEVQGLIFDAVIA